ncbi:MAG: hypothetical protein HZA13_08760 [Nitrospirae bacterium]|nr:hypothetical protein [Nitrospirota bacterium]
MQAPLRSIQRAKRALRGRLHPALPVEGDDRSSAEGSSQRADASVEGEAPKALPLEGATQAP